MNDELKIGDVVTMKSGSPRMTIIQLHGNTIKTARLAWFDGAVVFAESDFPLEALKKVSE